MDNPVNTNQPVYSGGEQTQPTPVEQTGAPIPPWIAAPAPTEAAPAAQPVTEKSPAVPIKKSPFGCVMPLIILLVIGLIAYFIITKFALPLWPKNAPQINLPKLSFLEKLSFLDKFRGNKKPEGSAAPEEKKITLTYWGLWESAEIMAPLITSYQQKHPNVTINYTQQSYQDYRERVQSSLARNEGPDLFRFHLTWLPMLKKEMAAAPSSISKNLGSLLTDQYYPVVAEHLRQADSIYGIPLVYDGLALFYNTKIFKEANKTYPTTWDELRRTALDVCVADSKDKQCQPGAKISVAGVALGTANNVDHFSDIVGLMLLQNGADLKKPVDDLAGDALKFYTYFATTDGVWNETLPPSTYAFAQEKVAMILAPSWRAYEITQLNPKLEFKTAPVPQLSGTQISWANFWAEGVSGKSENTAVAWDFLNFLTEKETLKMFYDQAVKVRGFSEAYPRKDMASELENDPVMAAFVKQASVAKSWYLCSRTHDNGINDKIIKYYEDAITSIVKGKQSVSQALPVVSQGVNQVLGQYGLVSP